MGRQISFSVFRRTVYLPVLVPYKGIVNFLQDYIFYKKFFYFLHSATVANLQAKVESLTTTNALMKEDLAIAKNSMIQFVEENNQLKHALGNTYTFYGIVYEMFVLITGYVLLILQMILLMNEWCYLNKVV